VVIYITQRHMVGGQRHEHIASVRWHDPATSKTGVSTREGMVEWIRAGGDARVNDGSMRWASGCVTRTHHTFRPARTASGRIICSLCRPSEAGLDTRARCRDLGCSCERPPLGGCHE
jgi:hypothetical protein